MTGRRALGIGADRRRQARAASRNCLARISKISSPTSTRLASAPAAEATWTRALTLARSVAPAAAFARYEALLDLAPAYLAEAARDRRGPRLAHAIGLWERAYRLGGSALALSLDPQGVAFELAGLVAELATKSSTEVTGERHDLRTTTYLCHDRHFLSEWQAAHGPCL